MEETLSWGCMADVGVWTSALIHKLFNAQ